MGGGQLGQYVNSDNIQKDIEYWMSRSWDKIRDLMDYPDGVEKNKSENADLCAKGLINTKKLDRRYSQLLINAATANKKISVPDIILSAFSTTIAELTKSDYVLFELVANGRDKIIRCVDLEEY